MKMSTNMSSLGFFLFLAFLHVKNICVGASKEFIVGDSEGWREPVSNVSDLYSQWAGRNQIHVGDSVVFKYKNDSVLRVDKRGYYQCNASHPISKFNNGNNVFHLHKPGPAYFISRALGHCKNGQRLLIEVMEVQPASRSPPSIASPPDPMSYTASAPSSHSGSGALGPASFALVTLFSVSVYFA